jgi:hypothetical protein
MLLERRKNASDTLGIQDFFPSHQLPVELSVTVKTGLDGQLRNSEVQLMVPYLGCPSRQFSVNRYSCY